MYPELLRVVPYNFPRTFSTSLWTKDISVVLHVHYFVVVDLNKQLSQVLFVLCPVLFRNPATFLSPLFYCCEISRNNLLSELSIRDTLMRDHVFNK
jgi:hypothetical protein